VCVCFHMNLCEHVLPKSCHAGTLQIHSDVYTIGFKIRVSDFPIANIL
jgi:hypothetical protein